MRKILLITGSRGEYGYIRPVLRAIEDRDDVGYELVTTNMHLLPEYGNTRELFDNDGFEVTSELYMAIEGSTLTSMVKALGVFIMSLTDFVHNSRPDVILISGDRGEQFCGAIVGSHLNIPVAHIQAGEISGNIDGLTRHAIARFSHVHFAANQDAADRLLRTGEQPFRVHLVGAPQLDDFLAGDYAEESEVRTTFHLDSNDPFLLLVQHPVTEQAHLAAEQMETTLNAILRVGLPTVVIFPNNDAGSSLLRHVIEEKRSPLLRVARNVSRHLYGGLMRNAAAIVGNSSSGLLEAPSFELPAVNIGRRQEGRVQGQNVINAPHEEDALVEAIRLALGEEFRSRLKGLENPYGDGRAASRIVEILAQLEVNEQLLFKRLTF